MYGELRRTKFGKNCTQVSCSTTAAEAAPAAALPRHYDFSAGARTPRAAAMAGRLPDARALLDVATIWNALDCPRTA